MYATTRWETYEKENKMDKEKMVKALKVVAPYVGTLLVEVGKKLQTVQ
jgi:hypothetical protein